MMVKRVCIIGGGPSGMTAIKACLEEGLIPVCYEKTDNFGGLWRYNDDETTASVWKSTIINSSKELTAFSDFPPPDKTPNFMHRSMLLDYIESYVEAFNLKPYIKCNHSVISVDYAHDHAISGKWKIQVEDKFKEITETTFDAVLICSGPHVHPHLPTFPGLDEFEGHKIHTKYYRVPKKYEEKRVLVIGMGNSGGDIAVEVSRVAKIVYLSTRRGSWIVNRVATKGYPLDSILVTRFNHTLKTTLPWHMTNTALEVAVNHRFDHADYGIRPNHRIFEQHMTVNDDLPNRIASGTLQMKNDIHHFTKDGVVFRNDDQVEYPIDAVIFATGYNISFPFLSEKIISEKENKLPLYKLVFPVHLQHPTLAIIGAFQPLGPVFPIFEMQNRWAIQVFKGQCQLPSKNEMLEDMRKRNEHLKKYFVDSQRYTIQVDYIPYMDTLAQMIGAKPNLLEVFKTNPRLFLIMYFGPCYSYQYRLRGPHKWSGAAEAIRNGKKRILAPLKTRKSDSYELGASFILVRIMLGIVFIGHLLITAFQIGIL